jgi:CRP-like cAMP-binding protein
MCYDERPPHAEEDAMREHSPENRVLRGLPAAEWRLIVPLLTPVTLKAGRTLTELDDEVQSVYFPESGLLSGLIVTADGTSIQGVMAGYEDVIGGAAVFGIRTSPWRLVAVAPGTAFAAAPEQLRRILPSVPTLLTRLARNAYVARQESAQAVACARFHELRQRLARWLLSAQDLCQTAALDVTHEQLATLLGAHRPTITYAALALEHQGFISTRRGHIEIADRAGLEEGACECYARVARQRQTVRNGSPPSE